MNHSDSSSPRLTSVMGVGRALLSTVGVRETVEVLIAEFGWDVTFQALSLLKGEEAAAAFGVAWEHLIANPVAEDLRDVAWQTALWRPEH